MKIGMVLCTYNRRKCVKFESYFYISSCLVTHHYYLEEQPNLYEKRTNLTLLKYNAPIGQKTETEI